METGDANRKTVKPNLVGRLTHPSVGSIFGVLRNPDRPMIFDFLFWSIIVLIYVFRIFEPMDLTLTGTGLGAMTVVCAVLVVVWIALPWRPSASRRRKLAAPAFLLAATAMLFASDLIWAAGLYPVAFANAGFLFGLARGGAYSAAALLALFVTSFVRSVSDTAVSSPETVVQRFAFITLLTVVCLGLSGAVIEARRSRERAESLLGDLETAHDELRRYAKRVRELTLSEERARMAREMHDSVGHHLTAVKLQAEAAVKTVDKKPEQAREQMSRARDLAAEAYEEARRSVKALRPPSMDERSGSGALKALTRSFEGTGFEVGFDVEGEDRTLSVEAELVLYRTLQEALTNAAKHSHARRVTASLTYTDERVELNVSDDGRGLLQGSSSNGSGLAAIRERVEDFGGTFSAGDAPGGGFVVEISLPYGGPEERSWADV